MRRVNCHSLCSFLSPCFVSFSVHLSWRLLGKEYIYSRDPSMCTIWYSMCTWSIRRNRRKYKVKMALIYRIYDQSLAYSGAYVRSVHTVSMPLPMMSILMPFIVPMMNFWCEIFSFSQHSTAQRCTARRNTRCSRWVMNMNSSTHIILFHVDAFGILKCVRLKRINTKNVTCSVAVTAAAVVAYVWLKIINNYVSVDEFSLINSTSTHTHTKSNE